MHPDPDIFDASIDRISLLVRSAQALKLRFGEHVLVREIAMLSETALRNAMLPYHKLPGVIVKDVLEGLKEVGLSLGMSWAKMPTSRHANVRNTQQMLAHKKRPLPWKKRRRKKVLPKIKK